MSLVTAGGMAISPVQTNDGADAAIDAANTPYSYTVKKLISRFLEKNHGRGDIKWAIEDGKWVLRVVGKDGESDERNEA